MSFLPDIRISWTVSRYIFWDLFKIFMMANGALAGIMSFGGLLRPLTQQGLDPGQIGALMGYFTPAMWAYSLPIAALFASTVIYGRLSADNELTACRAGGISHLSVAMPAVLLGILVAFFSFVLLSFVVPVSTLKVEKVIYSNIAKLISSKIERNHQVKFGDSTIFAQEAYLPTLSPEQIAAGEQQVVLVSPTIVSFLPRNKDNWHYMVPKEFWTASTARIFISRGDSPDVLQMQIQLENGTEFPRSLKGATQGGVKATVFGPMEIASPIKENTKFMSLPRLRELDQNKGESRRIQRLQDEFIDRFQRFNFLFGVRDALNASGTARLSALKSNQEFDLTKGSHSAFEKFGDLFLGLIPEEVNKSAEITRVRTPKDAREIQLVRASRDPVNPAAPPTIDGEYFAGDARVTARPRREDGQMIVTIALRDVIQPSPGEEWISTGQKVQQFQVPIPDKIRKFEHENWKFFASPEAAQYGNQLPLHRELIVLENDIFSELHSRASFAISCFILVLVGCALGMMFRSGNFLTAFAVSFVPALLSITLIIAGQRVCGNIGWKIYDPSFHNPLRLGLGMIWSGNLVNLIIAVALLGRLQRT